MRRRSLVNISNKSHGKEIANKKEENYSYNHQLESSDNLGEETVMATNQISQIDKNGLTQTDMSWTSGSELDLKIQEMISEVNGVLTCTVCGKTAKLKTNLKKHIETHIDGLSFPCQQCDKSFRSRNTLQHHVFFKHRPIKF